MFDHGQALRHTIGRPGAAALQLARADALVFGDIEGEHRNPEQVSRHLHMHMLVALHGQPGWVAVLTPLSVDGMIVAASTTLLSDSRPGSRGGVLPWALLVVGSVASLAANVAVAEPTVTGRVTPAWPSFALIAAYELLMRQVRHGAARGVAFTSGRPRPQSPRHEAPASAQSSNRNHP
jgi:hypothetical protein